MLEMFLCSLYGLVNSLRYDRPWHITPRTSSLFRNKRQGFRMVFVIPYKPHSVCQNPLPHLWASSHLIRCYTRISPWTCTRSVLHHSYVNDSQLEKSAAPHQIRDLLFSVEKYIARMTSKPGWQQTNLNSITTRPKRWLYRSLSLPPSQTMTVGSASVVMSNSVKNLVVTLDLSFNYENSHLKSGTLSQFWILPQ